MKNPEVKAQPKQKSLKEKMLNQLKISRVRSISKIT